MSYCPFSPSITRYIASEWTASPVSERRAHVERLLEHLEHRDVEKRFTAARRLLYVLQGFARTASPSYRAN